MELIQEVADDIWLSAGAYSEKIMMKAKILAVADVVETMLDCQPFLGQFFLGH